VHAPRALLLPIVAAALLVFVGGILIVVALSRGLSVNTVEPVAGRAVVVSPKDASLTREADIRLTRGAAPSVTSPSVLTNPPLPTVVAGDSVVTQVVAAAESSNVVAVAQFPPEPQLPKLQGIVFNPTRPTAFLNGKSVAVGGRGGEFTVLAITKQIVTVERFGQTNALTMEEKGQSGVSRRLLRRCSCPSLFSSRSR
jgi:hypothetical protein